MGVKLILQVVMLFLYVPCKKLTQKSRVRETPTLSTDADSRTDTNLKRLRDLSERRKKIAVKRNWGQKGKILWKRDIKQTDTQTL